MAALYPDLIEKYQELGAEERAAHSLFSAATVWQFLAQIGRAVEAYRKVAMDYRRLRRDDRLSGSTEPLRGAPAVAYERVPAGTSNRGSRAVAAAAGRGIGRARSRGGGNKCLAQCRHGHPEHGSQVDQARELAQITYEQLRPESDKATESIGHHPAL